MGAAKKTYHHGHLRAALLEAAARMIAEEGAECVTMRALSSRVGVSHTAPYRHFADKEALLVAVAAEGFARLKARLQAIELPEQDDDLARFQQMGVAYIAFAVDNPAHYRLMYGKEALRRAEHPHLQAAADAAYDELVAIIERYQAIGAIKPESSHALAYIAWSTVHGLASLLVDGQMRFPDDVEALARLTTTILLDGMKV